MIRQVRGLGTLVPHPPDSCRFEGTVGWCLRCRLWKRMEALTLRNRIDAQDCCAEVRLPVV